MNVCINEHIFLVLYGTKSMQLLHKQLVAGACVFLFLNIIVIAVSILNPDTLSSTIFSNKTECQVKVESIEFKRYRIGNYVNSYMTCIRRNFKELVPENLITLNISDTGLLTLSAKAKLLFDISEKELVEKSKRFCRLTFKYVTKMCY